MDSGVPPQGTNPYAPPTAPLDAPAADLSGQGGPYRPLAGLAKALTGVMAFLAVLAVASAGNALVTISIMGRIAAGGEVDQSQLEAIDQRSLLQSILELVASLAAVVLFCLFIPRANRNARSFGALDLQFSPRMAAGAFFIPLVNLWRPYQAMKEIWQASVPTRDPRITWRAMEVPGLLPAWWFSWIAYNLSVQVSMRISRGVDEASEFVTVGWSDAVSAGVMLVSSLLALSVVRGLTRVQEDRQRERVAAAQI